MSNSERLAEIKKAPTYPANIEDFGIVKIYKDDFNWLIEQAEKVEEIRRVFYAEDTNVVDGYRKIIEVFEGKEIPIRTKRS